MDKLTVYIFIASCLFFIIGLGLFSFYNSAKSVNLHFGKQDAVIRALSSGNQAVMVGSFIGVATAALKESKASSDVIVPVSSISGSTIVAEQSEGVYRLNGSVSVASNTERQNNHQVQLDMFDAQEQLSLFEGLEVVEKGISTVFASKEAENEFLAYMQLEGDDDSRYHNFDMPEMPADLEEQLAIEWS